MFRYNCRSYLIQVTQWDKEFKREDEALSLYRYCTITKDHSVNFSRERQDYALLWGWVEGVCEACERRCGTLFFLNLPVIVKRVKIVILKFTSALVVKRRDAMRLKTTSFMGGIFGLTVVFDANFSCKLAPIIKNLCKARRFTPTKRTLHGDLLTGLVITLLLALYVAILCLGVRGLNRPRRLVPLVGPCCLILLTSLIFIVLFGKFGRFASKVASAGATV